MSAVLTMTPARSGWRPALAALAVVLVAVLLAYRETFAAMVGIWSRSGTFTHGFVVLPISLWLVWERRAVLAGLQPQANAWMLLPMAAAAAAWLVGDIAGVNVITQFAATAQLVLVVPALLGLGVARALLFPLMFLFFMVPFGEFAMPLLMQWTADFTVGALKLFGVPVYREGLNFVIPSGSWSVVEACSGVRYLIASFMVGTLFANLNYVSTTRRALFVLVSVLVPVVANWLRAVMIVMLGHLSNNRLAVGVDHLIYGWVFFGLVIGLMFWIGARFSDLPAKAAALPTGVAQPLQGNGPLWPAAVMLLAVLAAPQLLSWRWAHESLPTPALALPDLRGVASPAGAAPLHQPISEGPKAEATRVYGEGPDAVTLHVAYFRQQTYGHKLVNSQHMIVKSEHDDWALVGEGETRVVVDGQPVPLRSAEIRRGTIGVTAGADRLQVRRVYWVGGRFTTSDHLAALYGVADRLAGRGDDGALLTFYIGGPDRDAANRALDAFVGRHLGAFGTWLDTVRAARG